MTSHSVCIVMMITQKLISAIQITPTSIHKLLDRTNDNEIISNTHFKVIRDESFREKLITIARNTDS